MDGFRLPLEQDLLEALDPNRDYGDRTFEEVVEQVQAGALILLPGIGNPVIKDVATGKTVKGTGKVIAGEDSDKRRVIQSKFLERAEADFDEVYASIMESVNKGDVRAMKLWVETVIGKPGEMRPTGGADIMEKIFEAMLTHRESAVRQVVVYDE